MCGYMWYMLTLHDFCDLYFIADKYEKTSTMPNTKKDILSNS